MSLSNKIDFAVVLRVKNANPNGDPLNGNRPRVNYDRLGEISDVCIKRKIRDRLQEAGQSIFVQSDDKKTDGMPNLRARAESTTFGLGKEAFEIGKKNPGKKNETAKHACEKWFDVRAFGQLFAFGKIDDASGVSVPIRGPVTIQSAFSTEPVDITSSQIVKSVNAEEAKGKSDISSDRMGMKHRIDRGVYAFFGSMNPQLAVKTGFNDEDAEVIKRILPRLFENDASAARPEGSMEVLKVIWWRHNCSSGQISSAKVHRSIEITADGDISFNGVANGPSPELIEGF